ncbi:MAG: DNA-packaging protein [Alphaproteobacteria bacterium]|nr:DNA-packaging protein [Alphaproteobacteria bacterium]
MMPTEARARFLDSLPPALREELDHWGGAARSAQGAPDGAWRVWLVMAGRGFGKTRAGAEWVLDQAEAPGRRIALVGATEDEARAVMVEGPSGLLACVGDGARPDWEPSLGRLTWPGGTVARLYSAANAEALRGPEHDFAWCDEVGKWASADAAWDNLMFGLRRGPHPQVLATTTPRATPLMRRIAALPGLVKTKGRTADNLALARSVVDHVTGLYGGTRLGRQELDGELIEDVEGSLWPRALIERCRLRGIGDSHLSRGGGGGDSHFSHGSDDSNATARESDCPLSARESDCPLALRRVVIGVDPPATAGGDACGIVVCGVGEDGIGYVLADATVAGLRPEGWARAVVRAAAAWDADRVVIETNQGGDMVESVLRSVDCLLPVRPARAVKGKAARAEPVAAWFEQGKAKLAGTFPALEDELAGMTIDGRYEGPGRSPDRADAMVWALTELLRERPVPRFAFL